MKTTLTEQPEWQALLDHHHEIKSEHMREWFLHDDLRFKRFSLQLGELLLDYSRNRIQEKTLTLLCHVAQTAHLSQKIQDLFAGLPINRSEQRPALHTALRDKKHAPICINGENIAPL